MHEHSKIQKVEDVRDIYSAIRGTELPVPHGFWAVVDRVIARGGPAGVGVLAISVLGVLGLREGSPIPGMAIAILVVVALGLTLAAVVLVRGKNAETGEYRTPGPAQLGAARAGPRKARASPGHERGG